MNLQDTLTQIVSGAMPPYAEIRVNPHTAHYEAVISWKLINDSERPNKQSKTITLKVSYEALQDIQSSSGVEQETALNRITMFLREKFKTFDPDHNEPYGSPSPTVTWEINSVIAGLMN
jgi:hypothetical protein